MFEVDRFAASAIKIAAMPPALEAADGTVAAAAGAAAAGAPAGLAGAGPGAAGVAAALHTQPMFAAMMTTEVSDNPMRSQKPEHVAAELRGTADGDIAATCAWHPAPNNSAPATHTATIQL